MKVPTYGEVTIKDYLAGAYFSYDGGATRYPVYVVNSGTTEGVALAARFVPPMNETAYLRKDTLDLFMDPQTVIANTDGTKYLPAWVDMKTDAKGFAYSDRSMEAAAPAFVGASWSYYVKGGVFFETKEAGTEENPTYTARPTTGDTAAAADQNGVMPGFLKRADGKYVVLQDTANKGNQYDVEIVVDQAFYDAMSDSMRAESPKDITLSYQCSNRKKFTFVKPKDFEWVCYKLVDNNGTTTLVKDETSFEFVLDKDTPENGTAPGIWHVVPTGSGDGRFCFALKVKNGSEAKGYTLYTVQDEKGNTVSGQPITVLMGMNPFLTIPAYSQVKTAKDASSGQNGREDINATASNGKLNLWFDPTQFNVKTEDGMETGGLQPGNTVAYVIEYRARSGNLSVNYDPEQVYDDAQKFEKALEDMAKDDDDDDDDDSSGEGSLKFNFYGTLLLDARLGIADGNWDISFVGGNVGTNFKAGYEWSQNFMCGPVPVLISFEVGFNADLEVAFCQRDDAKAMLLDAAAGVSMEAFAGLGFDLSLVAFKLGIFGKIGADVNFLYLLPEKETGTKLDIDGEIGLKMEAKFLFVSYKKTFASTGFGWTKTWDRYADIQEAWKSGQPLKLTGLTTSGRAYSMRLFANGTALVEIDGGGEIENRDYLDLMDRVWTGGAPSGRRLLMAAAQMSNALNNVETNAYPYANPVLTDDGSMFLYISDNNNAEELQSVVSYAVKGENGYTNMGVLDKDDTVLADSDVVASGTSGENNMIFAAWVKQQETPTMELLGKTMGEVATYDDLGMMMNATEIYAGVYTGTGWTTKRLTENTVADMAPTVASSGKKAIVAWRSMSATEMPAEGGTQDISNMFNAENNVNYRIYNNGTWADAKVAYNGAAGTVNAIDSAMLSDGTAILVYTVRTGEDITTTETFYTLIDKDGNVLTNGRLTNDSYTDTNARVTAVNDASGAYFVLGWYSEHDAGEGTTSEYDENGNTTQKTVTAHDIRLARINANGSVDASFPENIGGEAGSGISSDFRFSAPAGNTDIKKLSIVWSEKNAENQYELNAVRFYQTADETPVIGVSAPTDIAETGSNFTVDHFDTYTDSDGKVHVLVLGSDYGTGNLKEEDVIDLSDLDIEAEGVSDDMLRILSVEPVAYMKLGSGTFTETAIEVTADTNLRELVPGLDLPVQFTVKNTGMSKINKITVSGAASKEFTGLNLLPNETTTLVVDYSVPEDRVQDVSFTVTPDDGDARTVQVVLNRPDVGISGMKLLRESDKTRDIQVTLTNISGIPLSGSGKTVKLAFYKDSDYTQKVGDVVNISTAAYADIDAGVYSHVQTLNVSDFIGATAEIPDEGIRVYARAWVADVEEPYPTNNTSFISFQGLLTKYESVMTMDTFLEENNGQYTVNATIRNNSLQEAKLGSITADILDDKNHVLESVKLTTNDLTLNGEHKESLTSQLLTLEGTPTSVALRSSEMSVLLDAATNGGVADTTAVALTKEGTLPSILPEASKAGYTFNGWFTEPTGGEKITSETVFGKSDEQEEPENGEETPVKKVEPNENGDYVIYAQFTMIPTGGGTGHSGTSVWATDAIAWAVGLGIINGTTDADGGVILDPQGSATRAQVTAMTERFCERAA